MKKGILLLLALSIGVSCYAQNLLNGPEDMIYYPATDCFYVSNWAGNNIICIDQDEQQSVFKSSITHAHGMMRFGDTLVVATNSYIKKIDLQSSVTVESYYITGAYRLGHLTVDPEGIIYASDWYRNKIYTLDPSTGQSATLASNLPTPVGISNDADNARLILCCMDDYAPVRAVDISTGVVSEIAHPNLGSLDAITEDNDGNYYISVWSQSAIYKFDHEFLNTPELITSGHNGPSGLEYYAELNALGVTNYNANSVSLIPLGTAIDEPASGSHLSCTSYPNPFKNIVTISLNTSDIASRFHSGVICNLKGQYIEELQFIQNENQIMTSWDGSNSQGKEVTPGIYLFIIREDQERIVHKLHLIK